MEKAASVGIVDGVGNGKFDPDSGLTREQAATMLARLSNAVGNPLPKHAATFTDIGSVSSWAVDAVGQMQAAGIMQGVTDDTFSPKGSYQRQQSIVTISRLYDVLTAVPEIDPYYMAWALGCSAILATRNSGYDPRQFGMREKTSVNATAIKSVLSRDWGCSNREDLIDTIETMTDYGHNAGFAYDYALVSSLSQEEFDALIVLSSGMDKYMWPLTKSLGDKWGDKQIKAWDWFRMIHLAG